MVIQFNEMDRMLRFDANETWIQFYQSQNYRIEIFKLPHHTIQFSFKQVAAAHFTLLLLKLLFFVRLRPLETLLTDFLIRLLIECIELFHANRSQCVNPSDAL